MSTKYGFSDVREQLLHSIKGAYPTEWGAYQTATVLGEDVFGSLKSHPNAVLNLFLEQNIRFAIPIASYRAALGGFSSLISDEPGAVLPRLTLASTIYGMQVMWGGVFKLAYLMAFSMRVKECRDERCLMNGVVSPPEQGMEGLNRIYDAIVKEGKGDVFSSLPCRILCANCAKAVERDYNAWCTTAWKDLPRIFRVGKSWEEV
jgi:hypothetical protein